MTQRERDILHDVLAVVRTCQNCTRPQCSDECEQFTRAQLAEIAEHAARDEYKRIYI